LQTPKTPVLAGIKAIDWAGSVAITGGTVMFLLGLQFGGVTYPWSSAVVIALIVAGFVALVLFLAVERFVARYPIVPPHLFSNVSNLAIILVDFFHGTAFTQAAFFLPLYFQAVLDIEPLLSGVLLLPFALSLSLTAAGAGIFLKRTGRYVGCIRLGFAFSVLGCGLLYNLPDSRAWAKIVLYQVILGVGLGANFQPPLVALQSNVPAQDNASATATFSLVRNVSSAIAVVIGSAAFANKMTSEQGMLSGELGDDAPAAAFSGNNAQADVFLINTLNSSQQVVVRSAYLTAIQDVWIESVCFSAVGLISCLFIKNIKLDGAHVEVQTGLEGEDARKKIAFELKTKGKDAGILPRYD
jgi:hypothetical protein